MTRKFTFTILALLALICGPFRGGVLKAQTYTISSTPLTTVSNGDIVVWGTSNTNLAKNVASNWIYLSETTSEWIYFKVVTTENGFYLQETSSDKYIYSSADKKVELNSTNKTLLTITNISEHSNIVYGGSSIGYYTLNSTGIRPYKSTLYTVAHLYLATVAPTASLESIVVSGTPNKTTYEAGEEFDPAGLVVTGTYTEGDPEVITSGIDWTITPNPLTAGTTSVSVTAKVGEVESPAYQVNGLTVKAALPKITITADQVNNFTNTYEEYTWTASDVSGKLFAYKQNGMQFNTSKDGYYVYNTDPIPGNIRSIKMTTHNNGTEREWKVSVGTEQITSISGDAGTEPTKKVEKAGTTWTITGSNQYFCLVDKSGVSNISEIVITYEEDNTPSIEANVEEIEFEQKELDETVTDSKVISATGKNLTAPISASMKDGSAAVFSVVANGTPTAAEGEFTVSYSTTAAGEYAGTVVLSSGEASVEIPVSVNVVAHIPVLQSVAVSGTPDKTEYTEGDAFETAGLVVTGTYDVGDPQTITEGIEWTVTPSGALAANVTSVSVVATVDGVASEAFNVDIIVVELPKWAKVTANKTDWSGEYLLVYENEGTAYVWTGVDAAGCNALVTISNNQITKPADAVSLTIASMDGGYSILVNGGTNDGKYIYGTSGSNKINFGTTASLNTIAYPYANGNNSVKIVSNTATMRYNNASNNNRFRYFGSAGQQNVQLYEKVLPPTNEAVTFAAPEGGSLVIKNGETLIATGATIQDGTVLDVEFGMTPTEAYKDVAIKVTKTDGGDDVTSTVYDATKKQITMPRYAITVAVTFTKLYKISLVTAGDGTGSATMNGVTTDIYVDGETQINLVANAVAPNEFTSWSATDNITIDKESEAETYAYATGDGTITATFGISALLPLNAPTLSNPTNITYSGVTLNWEELDNAEAYNVELLLNDETVASDVITEATYWTPEVTLQANTTYTYTVQGVGDGVTYAEENNPKATSTFTTYDYPAVVLTLSENGIARNIPGKLNTPIDLPTTSTQTCEDKVFMGWSETIIDGVMDTEPSLLGETYTFTNPEQPTATIYAVYAKETEGTTTWNKVSTNYTDWNGNEFLIVYESEATKGYVMKKVDDVSNYVEATIANGVIDTKPNDAMSVIIEKYGTTNNYQLRVAGENPAKYLKGTSGNGLSFDASAQQTTISYDNTNGWLISNNSSWLRYNTTSNQTRFRFYKSTTYTGSSYKSVQLYKKTIGAPTYSNYCTTTPIVISGNIAWDNDVTISGNTVTIGSGAVLTVNGALTNTNAANLVIEDGGQLIVNNSGLQATMKKHIENTPSRDDPARSWYTISSPLAASTEFANVTNLIPNNVTDTDYDLYRFDEKNGMWINSRIYDTDGTTVIENENFKTIDKGVGYIYSNAATTDIAFKGEVNVADVDVKLSLTADKGKGFNLIGNPFAQNITLENIEKNKEILSGGFYVLTNQNTWGTELTTEEIKPLQGFLVQAKTAGNVTISKPAAKSKGERSNEQSTNIEMIVSNASFKDNAYAMFGEGTGLNKVSHRNAQAPMLYIPQDGEDFAIAFMDENTTIFPLSFKAMTTGSYSISLKPTDDISTLVLVDNMTGAETDMLLEDSYTFIGSPRDNENRFTVKLKISNNDGQSDSEHFAYQNGNELVVNGEGTLQIFDILGRVVVSEEVHGQTVNVGGLNTGAYIVRLTGESVMTQKIVVR